MKSQLIIFLITLIIVSGFSTSFYKNLYLENKNMLNMNQSNTKGKFLKGKVRTQNHQLKLIYYSKIDISNLSSIIKQIEKSAESNNINEVSQPKGILFGKRDLIVVNFNLILWFAVSRKDEGRRINSGGGLLSGAWEIEVKNSIPMLKLNHGSDYAPNLLLPGSSPNLIKYAGADIYGSYPTSKLVWGLELSTDTLEGPNHGKDILSIDKGPFSADEGVFIQFKGTLRNSNTESGFETLEDTDPRPGIIGKTVYTLTYRIPARRQELIQEIQFNVIENNFGPISNAVIALNLPGYVGKGVSYATNPEVRPSNKKLNLFNVYVNKYFRNSCVKKVFFYDIKYKKHSGSKLSAYTPPGRGKIACIGSPENKVTFICGYPTNDYIPKETYEEFVLEISDNQTSLKLEKFNSVNYKLLSTHNKSITLKTGEQLLMIMRYKFIDARAALAPEKIN